MKTTTVRKTKPPLVTPSARAKGFFRASSALFFILGMLVMLLSQWVLASLKKKDAVVDPEIAPRRHFEYSMVHLEVPDSLVPSDAEPMQSTRWMFEGMTPEELSELFGSCDLSTSQKEVLTNRKSWEVSGGNIQLKVSPEIIFGLSRAARDKIYAVLAKSQFNPAHSMPFRFSPDLFDGMLASSELTSEQVDQVKQLAWSREGATCFSDLDLLKGKMPPAKFKELVETLYSVPALLMRLRVTPETDVDALLKYWGKGGRMQTIKPLVDSLHKATNGTRVSVDYFLPPFARLRINTFPNPAKDPMAIRQDCFWSAMNFFNETPDNKYYDQQNTIRALQEDYTQTKETPVFGDRIMLLDRHNQALHMCVYIADGVVFTKNGADFKSPWVLMKLSDMLALYPTQQAVRVVTYRPKNA
ncbi:MAG TPA: hypothetical protein VMZ27_08410 [Candidatus Saccharimonadales bacterium]|nr:hypothetical protein [Candidatus Saccharimonadales bacterium]